MAPLADYETIPPEERLRRIGHLLCKAAVLALARREAEGDGVQIPAIAEHDGREPRAAGWQLPPFRVLMQ